MFSALKKLVGSEQAPGRDKNIPAGLQSMNQALQRRFAKGVQYNSECGPARGPPARGRGKWAPRARAEDGAARGVRRPGLGDWDLAEPRSRPRGLAVCGGCGRSCPSVLRLCCALTCGGYSRGLHLGSGVDAGPETRSGRTPGVEGGRLGPRGPSRGAERGEQSVRSVCTVQCVQAVPGALGAALMGPDNLA